MTIMARATKGNKLFSWLFYSIFVFYVPLFFSFFFFSLIVHAASAPLSQTQPTGEWIVEKRAAYTEMLSK